MNLEGPAQLNAFQRPAPFVVAVNSARPLCPRLGWFCFYWRDASDGFPAAPPSSSGELIAPRRFGLDCCIRFLGSVEIQCLEEPQSIWFWFYGFADSVFGIVAGAG